MPPPNAIGVLYGGLAWARSGAVFVEKAGGIECSEYCRQGVDEEKFFGGISETGTRCRLYA